jgi:hypothetical protein
MCTCMQRRTEDGHSMTKAEEVVVVLPRLGYQSTFDELFHRTLTKLRELELDKVDDEEELLAHLPSWSTAEENHQ